MEANGTPQGQYNVSLDLGAQWAPNSPIPFYIPPSMLQTTLNGLAHSFGNALQLPIGNNTAEYSVFEGQVSTGVGEIEAWTMSVDMKNGSGSCFLCEGSFEGGAMESASVSFDSLTGLRIAYQGSLFGPLVSLLSAGGGKVPYSFKFDQTMTSKPPAVEFASVPSQGLPTPLAPVLAVVVVMAAVSSAVFYLSRRRRHAATQQPASEPTTEELPRQWPR